MKFRDLLQDLLEEQLPCEKVVTYDMLKQAKDSGSKDVIFAFWEAKEFKRKENNRNK